MSKLFWQNVLLYIIIYDCVMFSIDSSLSQSEVGLGVWSLGSAEESQESIDLTQISVDVRNFSFLSK